MSMGASRSSPAGAADNLVFKISLVLNNTPSNTHYVQAGCRLWHGEGKSSYFDLRNQHIFPYTMLLGNVAPLTLIYQLIRGRTANS